MSYCTGTHAHYSVSSILVYITTGRCGYKLLFQFTVSGCNWYLTWHCEFHQVQDKQFTGRISP